MNQFSILNSQFSKRGFTLIELIVAIGLFSIMFAIAAGGFVSALRAQRQAASLLGVESNASIALERMAREIRTGYFFCDRSAIPPVCSCQLAPSGDLICSDLEYYNAFSQKVDYRLNGGILERIEDGGVPEQITGNNVTVSSLGFIVTGNTEGDHWTPRITVSIGVSPKEPTILWDAINFQTTVSARKIDCTLGPSPSC